MEAKNRLFSNGDKLLSVIDRLSYQNGNKLIIHQSNNENIMGDDISSNSRMRRKAAVYRVDKLHSRDENRSSMPAIDNNHQETCSEKRLRKFEGKCLEELSEVTESKVFLYDYGQTNTQGLPVPANVQLTLKPGISNGARPSLCFCKPATAGKTNSSTVSQVEKCSSGLDSEIVSEDISRTSVIQYASCLPNAEQIDDLNEENDSNDEGQFIPKKPQKHGQTTRRSSTCGICLLEFPSVLSLEQHRKENGHYLCSECGEALQDDVTFRDHVNKKLCKNIMCIFCGQKFVTRDEVENHKAKVHHKCLICNKLYKSAEKLLAHNERHHGAPYTCLQCGDEFPTQSLCKKHAMTKHRKKYYCPECGKGFTRMTILNRHATYTHSDEKNFKCEVCLKTFKRKDALKIHMITHSENKPFHCHDCGKQFSQKISFTKHLPCKQREDHTKSKKSVENAFMNNLDKLSKDNLIEIFDEERRSFERSSSLPFDIQESVDKTADEVYMGCRCPPSCPCKKFSIGLEVDTEKPKGPLNSVEEVASLSCCCDIGLEVTISD